jgi:hypothetical protein
MTTISKNHSGKVYKTQGSGYSVKTIFKKIADFARSTGKPYTLDCARTGSCYITFEFNNVDYSVRISNHTKRTLRDWDEVTICTDVVIDENEYWVNPNDKSLGMYPSRDCSFEILNTESKRAFFAHLGIK